MKRADESSVVGFSAGQSSKARTLGLKEEQAPTLRGGASGTNQVPTILFGSQTSEKSPEPISEALTLFAEASPAKTSRWLDAVKGWLASGAAYGTSSIASLLRQLPVGFSSRTSLAFFPPTTDETWESCFEGWKNSGTGGPTGCLTLNTSEWPKDAAVCSLSDVLETQPVPPKFYLSPKAATGILRRAEKRERDLPAALKRALQTLANEPKKAI